ncbi:MAG: hypothetical protein OXH79_07645 [Boseongicola sp.]|nr:hypothetical protein [Boseongicola sp.]
MNGADVSDAVTRGQFPRGDATLVVVDLANPDVDVAFSDFRDLETGARLAGRSIAPLHDIPLGGGFFGSKPAGSDDCIQGQFVGDHHAGVVGNFERDNVAGSFGGVLRPDDWGPHLLLLPGPGERGRPGHAGNCAKLDQAAAGSGGQPFQADPARADAKFPEPGASKWVGSPRRT